MEQEETVTRRQDVPATYVINGAVYVTRTNWLRETESFLSDQTVAHVMPEERSADVDTALDLAWCKLLLVEKVKMGT